MAQKTIYIKVKIKVPSIIETPRQVETTQQYPKQHKQLQAAQDNSKQLDDNSKQQLDSMLWFVWIVCSSMTTASSKNNCKQQ